MCSSPLPISGKGFFQQPFYRTRYFVPCGSCGECLKQKRLALLPRLEHEFAQAKFSTIMLLTYDELRTHNIYLHLKESDKREYGIEQDVVRIPAFSQSDFKSYFDQVRAALYKKYPQFRKSGIRFFCCSEYGQDPTRTMRGHFHLVCHFPCDLSAAAQRDVLRIQSRLWKHGVTSVSTLEKSHTFNSDYSRLVVQNSLAAARYVSKYVSKQIDEVDKRFRLYKDIIDRSYKNKSWYLHSQIQRCYRRTVPRVWYSRGYGSAAFNVAGDLSSPQLISESLLRGVPKADKSGYYRISRYYVDKYCYDFSYIYYGTCSDRERLHVRSLNSVGVIYKSKRLVENMYSLYNKLRPRYSSWSNAALARLAFSRVFGNDFLSSSSFYHVFLRLANLTDFEKVFDLSKKIFDISLRYCSFSSRNCLFLPVRASRLPGLIPVSLSALSGEAALYEWYNDDSRSVSVARSVRFNEDSKHFQRLKFLKNFQLINDS